MFRWLWFSFFFHSSFAGQMRIIFFISYRCWLCANQVNKSEMHKCTTMVWTILLFVAWMVFQKRFWFCCFFMFVLFYFVLYFFFFFLLFSVCASILVCTICKGYTYILGSVCMLASVRVCVNSCFNKAIIDWSEWVLTLKPKEGLGKLAVFCLFFFTFIPQFLVYWWVFEPVFYQPQEIVCGFYDSTTILCSG